MTAQPQALTTTEVLELARRSGIEILEDEGAPALLPRNVDKSAPRLWPVMDKAAFYGLPGRFVDLVAPQSEADPAALLVSFLVAFGNAVGGGPHANAEGDRHPGRENALIVGKSAKSRKGVSRGRTRQAMESADRFWVNQRWASGLSSGEGLVYHVRDAEEVTGDDKRDAKRDLGVVDKRLMVIEDEFGSLLRVLARDGNTLSPKLRQAWDHGNLGSLTKNDPLRATGAHVSVLAHITEDELVRGIDRMELVNGFLNRFLICLVERSQRLPHGGTLTDADFADFGRKVAERLSGARKLGRLRRAPEAEERWEQIYEEIATDEVDGTFGAVTARADAHTLRLSVIYALADASETITLEHLEAAWAVWRYAEASARYIFGDARGDLVADAILSAGRTAGTMDRTQVRDLFQRHMNAARIDAAIESLVRAGLVAEEKVQTDGRPRGLLIFDRDISDISDESPPG
jgi:hypothetical protein